MLSDENTLLIVEIQLCVDATAEQRYNVYCLEYEGKNFLQFVEPDIEVALYDRPTDSEYRIEAGQRTQTVKDMHKYRLEMAEKYREGGVKLAGYCSTGNEVNTAIQRILADFKESPEDAADKYVEFKISEVGGERRGWMDHDWRECCDNARILYFSGRAAGNFGDYMVFNVKKIATLDD